MRSKGHRQKTSNKFFRFIKFILKALGKARDFYVRSLERFASKINYGHCPPEQYYELPMRSFSESSSATSNVEEEDLKELIRAASVRRTDHENEIDMLTPKPLRLNMKSRGLPKNMGRIDEEKPCEFKENDVEVDFLVGKMRRFGKKYQN